MAPQLAYFVFGSTLVIALATVQRPSVPQAA